MNKIYLIRTYGVLNMYDTVILDCHVTTQIPCGAVDDANADVDRMLRAHDTCSTYELVTLKAE